jgi:hypothetical protein
MSVVDNFRNGSIFPVLILAHDGPVSEGYRPSRMPEEGAQSARLRTDAAALATRIRIVWTHVSSIGPRSCQIGDSHRHGRGRFTR